MNREIDPNQLAQIEILKKKIMSTILTKEAFERIGRIKIANPILAEQIELYLIQLYQTGRLKERITDEKLKEILNILVTKRKTKITRK